MSQTLSLKQLAWSTSFAKLLPAIATCLFASYQLNAQSVYNRYAPYRSYAVPQESSNYSPNNYQLTYSPDQVGSQTVQQSETRPANTTPSSAAANRYTPATPSPPHTSGIPLPTSIAFPQLGIVSAPSGQNALSVSQPTSSFAPDVMPPTLSIQKPHPNAKFADFYFFGDSPLSFEVTSQYSAEQWHQSCIVIDDAWPSQSSNLEISLQTLTPEARRDFINQLQIPEGSQVMSVFFSPAENYSSNSVQTPTPPTPTENSTVSDAATTPIHAPPSPSVLTIEAPKTTLLEQSVAPMTPPTIPDKLERKPDPSLIAPNKANTSELTKALPLEVVDRSIDSQATTNPKETLQQKPIDEQQQNLSKKRQSQNDAEERLVQRQDQIEISVQSVFEQLIALERKLELINERLLRLERRNSELEKRQPLLNRSAEKDGGAKPRSKPGERPKRTHNDDSLEKKGKKKPKERIDL